MTRIRIILCAILLGTGLQGCCCNCCIDGGYPVHNLHCQTPMPCGQCPWERCGPYVPQWCENAALDSYTQPTVSHHFH